MLSEALSGSVWNTKIRNWFYSKKASVRAVSALVWHIGIDGMEGLECREHMGTMQATVGKCSH